MADTTERLPFALSERLAATSAAIFSRQGREYDIAIGGIPFMLANSQDLPRSMETIQVRKDQFDAEADPGEQSLSGFWRRSQDSWHDGAGNLYQESRISNDPSAGFFDSENVDVFTQGKLTLLRRMVDVSPPLLTNIQAISPFQLNYVRINLCTDPSYERGTASDVTLTAGGGGNPAPTKAISTTQAKHGTHSLKLSWASFNSGLGVSGFASFANLKTSQVISTRYYKVTVWVFLPAACSVKFQWGASNFVSTTTTGSWVEMTLGDILGSDLLGFAPQISLNTTIAGATDVYVDDWIIEDADTAIEADYFDGDFNGGVWADAGNSLDYSRKIVTSAPEMLAWCIPSAGTNNTFTMDLAGNPISPTIAVSPTTGWSTITMHGPYAYIGGNGGAAYRYRFDAVDGFTIVNSKRLNLLTGGEVLNGMLWAKYRLWGWSPRVLYLLDFTKPTTSTTAATVLFQHPDAGWNWTSMCEGPASMVVAGHDGHDSTIFQLGLSSDGTVPAFTGARVSAVLPKGELVQHIALVGGNVLGIGTNRGFRIGTLDNDSITYGPLLFQPAGVTACTSVVTQGQYFLATFNSSEGALVYRIDGGNQNQQTQLNPYAKDVRVKATGYIKQLEVSGDRLIALTEDGKVWVQSSTLLATSGYLTTGRIRFHTNEKKLFKYVDLEIQPLHGTISVVGINEANSTLDIGTVGDQGKATIPSLPITTGLGPQKQIALKFTLLPDAGDNTKGPELNSYLVRALPSAVPQRMHTLPVLLADREKAQSGQIYGYSGYASERLDALQGLEDVGDTVVFQDFTRNNTGAITVIDSLRFVETSVAKEFGGILIIQLRTVTV